MLPRNQGTLFWWRMCVYAAQKVLLYPSQKKTRRKADTSYNNNVPTESSVRHKRKVNRLNGKKFFCVLEARPQENEGGGVRVMSPNCFITILTQRVYLA